MAITEPVPLYLLSEVGLDNQTPDEFSEAVEEGADVPPRVLEETLDLFAGPRSSPSWPTTRRPPRDHRAGADRRRGAGVPVVPVTETLPEGESYVAWKKATSTALAERARVRRDADPAASCQCCAAGHAGLRSRTLWSGLTSRCMPGEFIAVLGANGSGKSTLLQGHPRPAAA